MTNRYDALDTATDEELDLREVTDTVAALHAQRVARRQYDLGVDTATAAAQGADRAEADLQITEGRPFSKRYGKWQTGRGVVLD